MVSEKSQRERTPICRYCFIPMKQQGVLPFREPLVLGVTDKKPKKEAIEYDWICETCGHSSKDVSP